MTTSKASGVSKQVSACVADVLALPVYPPPKDDRSVTATYEFELVAVTQPTS